MEEVFDEFSRILEKEIAAGKVGNALVDKFNHLVNTWNRTSQAIGRPRNEFKKQPITTIQYEENLIEVMPPDVHFNLPEMIIGAEKPQVNFIKLSFGFININTISLLDVKAREVYINGVPRSLQREDVVKLIYWIKIYQLS